MVVAVVEVDVITIELRHDYQQFLAGEWPQRTRIDNALLPQITGRPAESLRLGDDFVIEFANARAVYRYVRVDPHTDAIICDLIKGVRDP